MGLVLIHVAFSLVFVVLLAFALHRSKTMAMPLTLSGLVVAVGCVVSPMIALHGLLAGVFLVACLPLHRRVFAVTVGTSLAGVIAFVVVIVPGLAELRETKEVREEKPA